MLRSTLRIHFIRQKVELKLKRGFIPHYTAAFVWAKVYTADLAWAFSLILTQFQCIATLNLFCVIHCYQECGPLLTSIGIVFILLNIWFLKVTCSLGAKMNVAECTVRQELLGSGYFPAYQRGVISACPPLRLPFKPFLKIGPGTFLFILEVVLLRAIDLVLLYRY